MGEFCKCTDGLLTMYSLLYFLIIALLVIYALSFFFPAFACLTYKMRLFVKGVAHLLASTDKKFPKRSDPALVKKKRSKRLIFVRHGESAWNVVFNRGFGPSFLVRLGSALVEEGRLLPTMDSVFFDSPLCKVGTDQALELQRFVDSDPVLSGQEGRSVLVASNLRRALSTNTIAFWNRLNRTKEKIRILSPLQEVTFNVDGVALAKPRTAPVLADTELAAINVRRADFRGERYFDATENAGDKPVRSRGIGRMIEFCQWVFRQPEETVIVNGHSLYFRFFFQTFLPHASVHEGKTAKMANCAVVALNLWEGEDGGYVVEEESINVMHRHFEVKKKRQ